MLRPLSRVLALALALAARPAAAAVLGRSQVRLQTSIPGLAAPASALPAADRALSLDAGPSLSPLQALPAIVPAPLLAPGSADEASASLPPAGIVPSLPSASDRAPSAAGLPAEPKSAAGQAQGAAKDVAASLEQGTASGHETLGRHFDGSAAAKPLAADLAAPSANAPALPGTVDFHGRLFPAAQFSEEGPGWMSSSLIAALDATQKSMDLALLEVMHKELADAVLRAHRRGVQVRVVIDSMHVYPEKPGQHRTAEVQALLDAELPLRIVRGRDRHGLMHNKFAVLDGQLLWSGSANWSRAADTVHQENATYTADRHRIEGFQDVWRWMWDLGKPFGQTPGRADGRVPPTDPALPVAFHGERLPAYAFAPGDSAEGWLLKAIQLSRQTLDIAMFSCTSERIKAALLAAKARGVRVRIVFDRAQFRFLPPMMWFADNGFDVLLAEGFRPGRSAMHHKFVIFDGQLVQSGSYNWTDGAKFNNFENIQFFDETATLAAYAAAYERLVRTGKPISEDDRSANRASAVENARQDAERAAKQTSGPKPEPQSGPGGLTRRLAAPWDGRRFALSPARRFRTAPAA